MDYEEARIETGTGGTVITNRSPRVGRKERPQPFPSSTINVGVNPALCPPSTPPPAEYRSTSTRPMREAVFLGLSFFFIYSSFQAIQNLQSSLHERGGLGVAALACVYGAGFCSSFVTPAVIYHTGVKAAIMAAWVGHVLFVVCNFFPHWLTLIPGSMVMGVLSCPLWTSLEIYMTSLARQEVGENKGRTSPTSSSGSSSQSSTASFHASFSRLNGAFFSIFMGSQFCGNLISSTILFQSSSSANNGSLVEVFPRSANELISPEGLLGRGEDAEEIQQCGVHFCSSSGHAKKELEKPDPAVVHALLTVFLVSELCGLAITAIYLPDLQQPRWNGRDVWRKLTSHLTSMTQPRLWLLVPFLVSRMMNLAIEVGTFTQAYISCTLGIRMVGYVMASWGLATMVSAALLGYLARYTGRRVLCVAALAFDAVIFLNLTWWEPRADRLHVFFLMAVLMGLVEGIWVVQVNALIATMFPTTADSAFAIKGMWSCLSLAATYLMASFLCPLTRIHVAILIIVVAFVAYVVLEAGHLLEERPVPQGGRFPFGGGKVSVHGDGGAAVGAAAAANEVLLWQ